MLVVEVASLHGPTCSRFSVSENSAPEQWPRWGGFVHYFLAMWNNTEMLSGIVKPGSVPGSTFLSLEVDSTKSIDILCTDLSEYSYVTASFAVKCRGIALQSLAVLREKASPSKTPHKICVGATMPPRKVVVVWRNLYLRA